MAEARHLLSMHFLDAVDVQILPTQVQFGSVSGVRHITGTD